MKTDNSVREMLKSPEPYLRRDACEAISESRMKEFVPDLACALRDEDPGVKEAALNALTVIGGSPVAEAVAPLLKEQDASLRNIGIEILELLGPDSFQTLTVLLNDKDDDVVKFAVDIIARNREERALGLLYALITHKNPNVRASVAVCLGRLKSSASLPVLQKALYDPEEWVRFSAVEGLGLIQDNRALVPLLGMIERDSGLIKEAAIEAVGKLASSADATQILTKLEPLVKKGKIINTGAIVELFEKATAPGSDFRPGMDFKKTYFNFFSKAVDDPDKPEQLKALRGFAFLKLPEGLEKVFFFLNSLNDIDEDTENFLVNIIVSISGRGPLPKLLIDEIRKGGKSLKIVVKSLGEMKSGEAVPLLKELIGKAAKHDLREVVSALEAIGSVNSLEVLYQSLKSSDGHTRKIAARALSSLAGPAAAPRLFEALQVEAFRDVMEEIADVLSMIPSEAVKKGFCAILSSPREQLREMGARGLGLIGDEEALEFLKRAATDESPSVRKAAYKSMARLGIPDAVEEILKGLDDPNEDVKLSVLKALNGWSGEKIKSALVKALRDRNVWIRYNSVLLLGDLGENDVESLILEMLLKDEAPVKAAAAKALEKMGSLASVATLEKFINHPDPTVRGAVENAIGSLKC